MRSKPLPEHVSIHCGSYRYDMGRNEIGKRVRITLSRVSHGDHALYQALANHTKPKPRDMSELMDIYIAHGMQDFEPKRRKYYLERIDQHLRDFFGPMQVDDIGPMEIGEYRDMRVKAGEGLRANRECACLRWIFEYGIKESLCQSNPCA